MFPDYTYTVLPTVPEDKWFVQAQGLNECGCTTPANALNLIFRDYWISKDQLVREAGLFFQAQWGGSPSFVTGCLLQRHGAGTHFGNLSRTNGEAILRDLILRGVPVCIELGENKIGNFTVYGEHAVLLVGFSDPYTAADGLTREEYYVIDAQYTVNGQFGLHTNNVDRDSDGVDEVFPGNRTYQRKEFWDLYPTGIYFPVFPSQPAHDQWYRQHLRPKSRFPIFGALRDKFLTGQYDEWLG